MSKLQIIGGAPSNFVWAVRIACEEKGVDYEHVSAAPHTPEVLAINPLGKIPVMRHGDVALYESRAIAYYIDRVFPGPPLVPPDAYGAAMVEQWVSCVNTSVDPVCMREYALSYFFPGTPDRSPNRPRIEAALPAMEKLMAFLDASVAKTGHLVGDAFTLADMNVLPILHYMSALPESAAMLAKHPSLKAYVARHLARPSVEKTKPPPRKA